MALHELVYAENDVADLIIAQWPNTVITDASDYIHTERFEVDIEGVEPDDFYSFAINEGFALNCLSLRLATMSGKEGQAKVRRWIDMAQEARDAE